MLQALSEKHNSFLRPLKKKGFQEERVTTIGLYDIGKSHDPGIQQEPGLVQCEAERGEQICDQIERLKWSLWHGQVDKALAKINDLQTSVEPFHQTYARYPQLVKALSELHTYIVNNRHLIPNYGERYRHGEAIATGFVESTVNQVVSKRFCKKQQMQWSKRGAHLLLQTRVKTLNRELGSVFKRWYPDIDVEELDEAA